MSLDSLPKFRLRKSCLNSRLMLCILYFLIYILNTQNTVLLLKFCETKGDECYCPNNTNAVQCFMGNPYYSEMANAQRSYKLFCEVMSQFNCETQYSVKWNCTDCLEAYTMWLLAIFAPKNDSSWLSNCTGKKEHKNNNISHFLPKLCKDVQARCPYFAPQESYGDAPAFDCP